ncbi:hypothetical protein [Nonomuraea aridisoli]|nr:hypothetical protein [Nonomuraea aridisoli]
MGRHEEAESPKVEDFDPKKHGVPSTGDHNETGSGKHGDKGKDGDK